jgi:putative transposase
MAAAVGSIALNSVLEAMDGSSLPKGFHRVVHIEASTDRVWLMGCNRPWHWPEEKRLSAILDEYESEKKSLELSDNVLSPKLTMSEESLCDTAKAIRKRAWEAIEPLVTGKKAFLLFDPRFCGNSIATQALEANIDRRSFYRFLLRYFAYGMTENALLPDYPNCGAPGSKRTGKPPATPEGEDQSTPAIALESATGDVPNQATSNPTDKPANPEATPEPVPKRIGRPYSAATRSEGGVVVEFNTQPEHKKIFQRAIDLYWGEANGSLRGVYDSMVKRLFTCGVTVEDGVKSAVPMHPSNVPTYRMFQYWYEKEERSLELLKAKLGPLNFKQSYRAMHGRGREDVIGPGTRYQIDATLADVYLVHTINRQLIIGRPVVYLVVDTFSTMIVGFYIGLEGPSWNCARLALRNAFRPKPAICGMYGLNITEEDWPCHHVCAKLGADRQELLTNAAELLRRNFRIECEIASAYRPDMKFVETRFHLINLESDIHFLPGAVTDRAKEWGKRDYRLDATLDLIQFGNILLRAIIHYNKYHDIKQHRITSRELIKTSFPATPINFWNYGRSIGLGSLNEANPNLVLAHLCPTGKASITARGISFQNRYYETESALAANRFDFVRAEGQEAIDVQHDDEWTNEIWIPNKRTGTYETARLRDIDASFRNIRLQEANDIHAMNNVVPATLVDSERKAKASMDAAVENILALARAAKDATPTDLSNSARLRGIGANRAAAAAEERERDAQHAYAPPAAPVAPLAPTDAATPAVPAPPAQTAAAHAELTAVDQATAAHNQNVISLLSAKRKRERARSDQQ